MSDEPYFTHMEIEIYDDDEHREEDLVKDCDYCGCCETPNACPWSITCPTCGAEPREQCFEQGGRLVGLHDQRRNT